MLDLDVLASTSIKRKKPWPRIVWAGQEKESLFLLDNGRISVLYVPSGKTKRKVPKLSPLVEEAVHLTPTKNGLFLVGLLKSGDVIIWHKDRDALKTVTGLSGLVSVDTLKPGTSLVCISDDCTKILVVVDRIQYFLWQQDSTDGFGSPTSPDLTGHWSKIKIPDNIPVASPDCAEASVSAIFYSSPVLGECCQCSVTFNKDGLCVTTLLLRLSQYQSIYKDNACPSFHEEWSCLQHPMQNINTGCQPINAKGAYVTCYSHDGQVISVAANQKSPSKTCVLFISPLTETVLVSELRGCGVQNAEKKSGRGYWVSSMAWTYDNLFLVCMLNTGSMSIMSRLGEPIIIQTSGCSVDFGPSRFLPIHPVVIVQREGAHDEVIDDNVDDPLQQIFSVSTHPSLPIILFSDGYMVTVIQMPCDTTCMTFMRDLVLESSKHLKKIQEHEGVNLTLASPYNLPVDQAEQERIADKKRMHALVDMKAKSQNAKNLRYSFEDLEGSLNETQDSEISAVLDADAGFPQFGAMQNLSSGKILFGEPEMILATVDSLYLNMAEQEAVAKRLKSAKVSLFMSWKIAASHTDTWTSQLDTVAKGIVQNIVKMFALILNCPAVGDMFSPPAATPPSVQNGALFEVISMYRQMLQLLQFDVVHQNLIPVSVLLAHRTAGVILESPGLGRCDPRLKTLNGCYTLLRFTEKTLNKTYVWLPKSVSSQAFTPRSGFDLQHQYQRGRSEGAGKSGVSQLLSRKLSATWSNLYKCLIHFQKRECQTESDQSQAQNLLCQIQQALQQMETPIPQQMSPTISQGDKHSLDGHHTLAVNAWSRQLQAIGAKEDSSKAANLLHSVLYTYLLRDQLLTAVDFVDSLILRANVPAGMNTDHLTRTTSSDSRLPLMTLVADTLKTLAFDSPDMVPCIRDRSIRQVVQTMARFMAAYFANQTLYVFPAHSPKPLPAVHFETPITNTRIIPRYHEDLSAVVRRGGLSGVWTVDRTLEYLLLSGLVCEAAWFADKMGDWKAAFMMAVGCVQHHHTAPKVYAKPRKPLMLPDSLQPLNILQSKLKVLLGGATESSSKSSQPTQDYIVLDGQTDTSHLRDTLADILTSGIVGRVEVAPWLLVQLVDQLKTCVSQLSPLVPDDFYLPAPPLFCPQPSPTAQDNARSATSVEREIRRRATSLIQLTLCVLDATHLSLPVVNWYVRELTTAQDKAGQFKANMEGPCTELPELLQRHLQSKVGLTRHEDSESVQLVLAAFRDFCSMLWMLHARDKLSVSLRQRQKHLDQMTFAGQNKLERDPGQCLQECFSNLQWAAHMLAFSRFLPDEGSVYKVILSLLLELPPSEDVANILAEYFYDRENLDFEVQEKLEKMLGEMQRHILQPEEDGRSAKADAEVDEDDPTGGRKSVTFFRASPRGKSLSVYFYKQSQVMGKLMKKRRMCFGHYDEFVFSSDAASYFDLNIGSRPYETKRSFVEFMDMFCSVSFGRLLEADMERDVTKRYPILNPWADTILQREMSAFLEGASHGQKRHSFVVMTPRDGSTDRLPRGNESSIYHGSGSEEGEKNRLLKAKGLFRSKSAIEVNEDKPTFPVRRYESENGINAIVGSPRSKHGSQQNLSELASRYGQSDEALYRHDDREHFWSLNVNFGHRYNPLKHLLGWLEHWNTKSHSLGLGRQDQKFHLKPTMKIPVPSQLVLLSLWLLENKYVCKSNTQHPAEVDNAKANARRRRSRRRISDSADFNKTPPQERMKRSSRSPQDQSPSRDSLGVRTLSLSPQSRGGDSLRTSAVLEEENVRSAYEQILDGPDDSSSLGVSSLASDELDGELRQTLSIIKGTGSPQRQGSVSLLNRTIQLQSRSLPQSRSLHQSLQSRTSPVRGDRNNSSPTRGDRNNSSPIRGDRNNSSPARDNRNNSSRTSKGRGRSPHSSPGSTQVSRSSHGSRSRAASSPVQQSGTVVDGGIASQLQNIVRTEMRRIMEVQHQSLMAMMGAIDDDGVTPASYPVTPHNHSPHPERMSRIEDFHQSVRAFPQQQQPMRIALSELRNLQNTTVPHRSLGQSPGKENSLPLGISDLKHPKDPSFPRFLRIPAERDTDVFKLPNIPVPAWNELSQPCQNEAPQMPLLHIQGSNHPGAQPPPYERQIPNQPTGFPLLRIEKEQSPFSNVGQQSYFGQMVPPDLVFGHDKIAHQRELSKQRHLQEFHQHYVEEQTELHRHSFGEQLLRVDFRGPRQKAAMTSPRRIRRTKSPSEKSTSPSHVERSVAERDVETTPRPAVRKSGKEEEETSEAVSVTATATGSATEDGPVTEQDTEEDSGEIDDGYILQPGAFDAYLHLGRALGVAGDTDAEFQYQLAMKIRQQQRKRGRKVDFSTMTRELVDGEMSTDPVMEVVRTAEAATSITKDTGVDPIQEALIEYNLARQGTIVPPDIFMGLRFGDGEQGQESEGQGRAYLNVVDIRASTVLRDLSERTDSERIQPDSSLQPSALSVSRAARFGQMEAAEENLRESLEPPRRYAHDPVTIRMFETKQAGEDRISVALMPKGKLKESKIAMMRRLREMNEQMHAIDEMSSNMEADFLNTHMLINTLDAMAEAAHPSGLGEIISRSRSGSPLRKSAEDKSSRTLTPKASDKSPQTSSRSTKKSARTSADVSHMSGLSGISDIIGEIIADGGVDLAAAGISTTEADRLAQRARERSHGDDRVRLSMDKLQQMVTQAKTADNLHDADNKRELQQWMSDKFQKRQHEFRKQRADLREREHSPYKSRAVGVGATDFQGADRERTATRKHLGQENMDRRLQEAELLLGDILVDKPVLPAEKPSPRPSRKPSPQRASPFTSKRPGVTAGRVTKKTSPSRIPTVLSPTLTDASPTRSLRGRGLDKTRVISSGVPRVRSPESPSRKGILKTSNSFEDRRRRRDDGLVFSDDIEMLSDFEQTVGSTTDLLEYARQVEEMDARPEPAEQYRGDVAKKRSVAVRDEQPQAPYKPKAFHELVRLQRPEILRKAPVKRVTTTTERTVERSAVDASRQTTGRESTMADKERLYGSKHIPGTARKDVSGPRRVKTYAERLQEMKPRTQYSTPIVPRQHVPQSARTRSTGWQSTYRRPTPTGPKHKPQTYVEQLKKINANAPRTRTFKGGRTMTIATRTFLKARKPAHAPKSYVEQLQEVYDQAPETLRRKAEGQRYPSTRGVGRPRPYRTPYRSVEEDLAEGWEVGSGVSDWVVEDDVRNLIYGDDDTSVVYTLGGSISGLDVALSDGRSDYYDVVMGDIVGGDVGEQLYTTSVDVDEIHRIADAVSVSSGSVLSVIDWDAVDRLIEDED